MNRTASLPLFLLLLRPDVRRHRSERPGPASGNRHEKSARGDRLWELRGENRLRRSANRRLRILPLPISSGGNSTKGAPTTSLKDGTVPLPPARGPIKHFNFDWEPGFKVGAGYPFEHDALGPLLPSSPGSKRRPNSTHSSFPALHPLVGQTDPHASKAKAPLACGFPGPRSRSGRNTSSASALSLHPFFGLASPGSTNTDSFAFITNTGDTRSKAKMTSGAIGPRLGLDAQFFFTDTFSLYGAISGTLSGATST